MQRSLEGDLYSDLSVNGAALIKGRRLFEALRLLEEIRYIGFFRKYYSSSESHPKRD